MKKKQKLISLLALLCAAMLQMAWAAAVQLTVEVPTQTITAGETFTVSVQMAQNTGFSAIQFTLGFDKADMECTAAKTGSLLSGMLSATNPNATDGAIIAAASATDITGNGTVASFTFTAKRALTAPAFTVSELVLSDSNGADVAYSLSGATMAEEEKPAPAPAPQPDKPSAEGGAAKPEPKPEPKPEQEATPSTPTQAPSTAFTDVPAGFWGAAYITQAAEKGLFQGYPDGTFHPNDNVTRAQFVTVLYRMAGSPQTSTQTPFADISTQSAEFQRAIAWAYQNGYVNGKSAGRFDPRGQVTREEAMKILFLLSGGKQGGELMFTAIYNDAFADSGRIAAWAKDAMYWGIYHKLISGTTATTLAPKGTATRVQLAAILLRYIANENL